MIDRAIHLQGITKSFGEQTAVEDLDLCVPSGSIYGLLGPNGAGKTTTLRIILDIIGPDRGRVEVLGSQVDDAVRLAECIEQLARYGQKRPAAEAKDLADRLEPLVHRLAERAFELLASMVSV